MPFRASTARSRPADALLHAVILFRQLAQGFRSSDLRQQLAALSGRDPESVSQGAVTCQLRRIRT
jgi:hypothetical protein